MVPGIRLAEDGKYFALWCKGCREIHGWIPLNTEARPGGWKWDAAKQTLNPSVRHFVPADEDSKRPERTTCHYNVRDGRIEYLRDSSAHQLRDWHDLDEVPPADYGGREQFGFDRPPSEPALRAPRAKESRMGKKDENEAAEFPPTYLYHAEKAAEGELFTDQEAHDAALKDGYVDTPAKFGEKTATKKK